MTAEPSFDDLLARAQRLAVPGARHILGIAGPPGAGKSTLAARLVAALGERAVRVGMDGFHLSTRELARLGRGARKGAPDTFDAEGYVELLRRLRDNRSEVVYAPEFRRDLEEPVAGSVPVASRTPLVVTEGNYLLLPERHWVDVRPLLDEVWFLAPPEEERLRRLVARHEEFGRTPEQARHHALGSDQANARRIAVTAGQADWVVRGVR